MSSPHDAASFRKLYLERIRDISLLQVDDAWWAAQDPKVQVAMAADPAFDLRSYYLDRQREGSSLGPNPFFDWALYRERSRATARRVEVSLEEDLLTFGASQDISPSWIFDPVQFATVSGIGAANLQHLRRNYGSLYFAYLYNIERFDRPTPLFSAAAYRRKTGLDGASNREALADYLARGCVAGLHGCALFDEDWYRTRYADQMIYVGPAPHQRFRSAIEHFLLIGLRDNLSPIPDFDSDFYVQTYPEVADMVTRGVVRSPIEHFLSHLQDHGLRPNPYFDPVGYLERHPNVLGEMAELAMLHPLEHFLEIGYRRGYRGSPPLLNAAVPEAEAKSIFEKRARAAAHHYLQQTSVRDFAVESPAISAVIPVCDHFDFTASVILQIAAEYGQSAGCRVQIIVVDNGSRDRTRELPDLFPGVTYLRTEQPIGYTAACNLGARTAVAETIIFLNNDIELGHGAFDFLRQSLWQDETVGIVGGKIILTDGRVQEAGGVLYANGGTAGYGRGLDPIRDVVNLARDVDFVSGCLLATRRAVFEELGGFDEQFSPGYFEDCDLCMRAEAAGYRIRYAPKAYMTHYEYGTYSKGRPKEIAFGRMYANKDKFVRKHQEALIRLGASPTGQSPAAAAFRRGGRTQPFLLLIEDLVPTHMFGSGFVRTEDVLKEFLARGWRVTVFPLYHRDAEDRFIETYEGRVDVRFPDEISLDALLDEIGPALDLVWTCRTHNFGVQRDSLLRWRSQGAGRRIVADTEALALLRERLPGRAAAELLGSAEAKEVVRDELSGARDFDQIVCVGDAEAALARDATSIPTAVLGHRLDLQRGAPGPEGRRGLLFLGAIHAEESPNMDSLVWFASEVLPILRRDLPDIGLDVVGYLRQGVDVDLLLKQGISFLGQRADLTPIFLDHRVFVAPTRFAAGLPHKVQQAQAQGLPSVITSILADQLEPAPGAQPFLSARIDAGDFAAQCLALYTDETLWRRVQADAWREIERQASPARFAADFDRILEAVR